jgi:hypothetical protein
MTATATAQRTASHNGHTPRDVAQDLAQRAAKQTRKPAPKLTAKLARDLADADAVYEAALDRFNAAKDAREKVRKRARRVLKPGEPQTAGGYLIKLTAYKVRNFSLTDYEAAGNKLTAAMRKCISRKPRETWTVKRVK